MKIYADELFYMEDYLSGRKGKVPIDEFSYWAMLATSEIKNLTFGRVESLESVPEEVKMCCCEVAEKLYAAEAVKGKNGLILQSYGNDGQTGTFKVDEMSESSIQKSVAGIIRKWLVRTGLMYCGVMG